MEEKPLTINELLEKRVQVGTQMRQAKRNQPVQCRCGVVAHSYQLYRCYYCLEYYCERCAPEHFGGPRKSMAVTVEEQA